MSHVRTFAVSVLGLGLAISILMLGLYVRGLRFNGSPSFPIGFYEVKPLNVAPRVGTLVLICPTNTPDFQAARRRGYLGYGTCPGHFQPLLKKIAAVPGDVVTSNQHISINQKPWPKSEIYARDGAGRPLAAYKSGVIPKDQVLVLSDHFSPSFDGRYFGPLPIANIVGEARPIWLFEPSSSHRKPPHV